MTRWGIGAGFAAGLVLAAVPAMADDLRSALVMAYTTNPTLQSARAQQRAVDEGVPIARSASLPSLSGTATYTEFLHGTNAGSGIANLRTGSLPSLPRGGYFA